MNHQGELFWGDGERVCLHFTTSGCRVYQYNEDKQKKLDVHIHFRLK